MTDAKHTPGPWHIGRENDHSADRWKRNAEWARVRDEAGGLIAEIASVHPKGGRKSCDFDIEAANARLIAAAPDLLAALKAVENDCMDRCDSLLWGAIGTRIRAAIAKATGGEA
jgi:hypothetical protein